MKTKEIHELRDKFFNECTNKNELALHGENHQLAKTILAPHDLFEWFVKTLNLNQKLS